MDKIEFQRGIGVKESLDIGDKAAQCAGRIGEEAKRLRLIKSPDEDVGNLFPKDDSFHDIAQWVLPNDKDSGILFCQYVEYQKEVETAAEFHILIINKKPGEGKWDEQQFNYEDAMEFLGKFISWEDLSQRLG